MSEPLSLKQWTQEDGTIQRYAWPGAYPIFYLTADNGVLCPQCIDDNRQLIEAAQAERGSDRQWEVIAADVNYDHRELFCDHCNRRIEAAYVD